MAVESAGPYASLHLAPEITTPAAPTTYFLTGRMPLLPPTDQQRQSTESNKTDNKTYNFTGRYMFSARKRRYNAATSELRAMERVYYVVTDDSDGGDDDVINSRRTDDAIGNCSGKPLGGGGGGTVPFRVLRAYRKRHRRHRRHDAATASSAFSRRASGPPASWLFATATGSDVIGGAVGGAAAAAS